MPGTRHHHADAATTAAADPASARAGATATVVATAAPAAAAATPLAPAGSLKASTGLIGLVARAVSPRIGAVRGTSATATTRVEQESAPSDVPGLTAALGRAQREIVRLKDEVAALLSAAAGRSVKEGRDAQDAVEQARHESKAGAAAREEACRDLSSLEYGMESQHGLRK